VEQQQKQIVSVLMNVRAVVRSGYKTDKHLFYTSKEKDKYRALIKD
jgi:hypothetical protein